jgi:hypothetical protein
LLCFAVAFVVVVGLMIVIAAILDQDDSATQPQRGFVAGPAEEFQRADVNEFSAQRVLLVRMPDGEFVAFYDQSPRRQELPGGEACRVLYEETATLGLLEQLPGMRGALVEDCDGARTVWRLDGEFAFGAGYDGVPLDRFETSTDGQGNVVIDTSSRTCTRSRGVAGVPPFVQQRCGEAD